MGTGACCPPTAMPWSEGACGKQVPAQLRRRLDGEESPRSDVGLLPPDGDAVVCSDVGVSCTLGGARAGSIDDKETARH